jgi:uncharacterized membrane protein YdjX (TVP38/TMEM64 family)
MWIRLGLLFSFFAAIVGLYSSGAYEMIDARSLQAWIRSAGTWGAVAFVLGYAVLQPLGVRSLFFLIAAPLIWSPTTAFCLSWLGAVAASIVAFGLARFVAREWAQRRAPARVRRLDAKLAEDGFRTVTLLRFVFYTTPALQLGLGVSQVRVGSFILGTIVGVLPFTLIMTFFGAQLSAFFWRLLS